MIQEIIEGLERSLGQSPINEILAVNRMQSTNIVKLSSSLQKDSSSISTLGSLNEFYNAGKTYPEKFIKCIFDKFSSNGLELTKSEFTDFFLSQPWILTNIQESFKISNWINVPKPKPGRNVPFVQYSTIGPSCTAKVQIFFRGNWIRRNVEIRENYLLFYLEKKHILDEIMYLEGCFVKVKESSLYIIYSTQYDERLSLRFTTKEECIIFAKEAKIAGKIHSFKEYYKRGESLGHGKFSDVYVATELATNSTWAVKCIHKRMMDQSERELIRKELTILSSLNFHGIVKFKEVFETRKHVMVVMEKMEGTDLLKKINGGMLDEYEIKSIIRQILQAVCYIHQLGVIHRDLKPENVLVTKIADDFNVKLIDFGLATYYFPKNKMNYCCGTLGYTAPEIFSGNYNTKIDVWSIGIITFAMISGKLPFYSHFKDETIEMTQTQPVLFEGEKWDKCSENAKDFIENLLRKDPDVRYDCLQALDHAWLHN